MVAQHMASICLWFLFRDSYLDLRCFCLPLLQIVLYWCFRCSRPCPLVVQLCRRLGRQEVEIHRQLCTLYLRTLRVVHLVVALARAIYFIPTLISQHFSPLQIPIHQLICCPWRFYFFIYSTWVSREVDFSFYRLRDLFFLSTFFVDFFEGTLEEFSAYFWDHLTWEIIVFHERSPSVTCRFQALACEVYTDYFFRVISVTCRRQLAVLETRACLVLSIEQGYMGRFDWKTRLRPGPLKEAPLRGLVCLQGLDYEWRLGTRTVTFPDTVVRRRISRLSICLLDSAGYLLSQVLLLRVLFVDELGELRYIERVSQTLFQFCLRFYVFLTAANIWSRLLL